MKRARRIAAWLRAGAALLAAASFGGQRSAEADPQILAVHLTQAPTLASNGSVDPSQFGGSAANTPDFTNTNPGNTAKVNDFTAHTLTTLPSSSYNYGLYAGYTDTTLYLGFNVHENVVSPGTLFVNEDDVELFIGGKPSGDNFVNFGATASKDAFQLVGGVTGNQFTSAGTAFTNTAWTLTATTNSTGYSVLFAIPLNLINTADDSSFAAAHAGSNLHFNVGSYYDNGRYYSVLDQFGPYGATPAGDEYRGGQLNWPATLTLAASSVPEPSPLALGGLAAVGLAAVRFGRRFAIKVKG